MADTAQNISQRDLIVARATAPGPSAIAVIRVDGAGAAELTRRVFVPNAARGPADLPRRAVLGHWVDPQRPDAPLDEGLAIFFRGPNSYTGNDLVEFQCHGGAAVARELIALIVRMGARPAEPGEFTRRAFLNGRMDLARAEAVADIIQAETAAAARAAQAGLAGGLSDEIERLRQILIVLGAEIEARIDFPDEDLGAADLDRLGGAFGEALAGLDGLLATGRRGRLLRRGATVALFGPPNVGKSSLLNALAREERAIVTPHPGTTRDTLECVVDLAGIPVTLIDTAGLREAEDPIERLGVERARRALLAADLAIELRDATGGIGPLRAAVERVPDLIVENKADLAAGWAGAHLHGANQNAIQGAIRISALTGQGLEELERAIVAALSGEDDFGNAHAAGAARERVAVNERQAALIVAARGSLAEARAAWDAGAGGELVMIDLREALGRLDETLGIGPHEAILDHVFSRFCLGK